MALFKSDSCLSFRTQHNCKLLYLLLTPRDMWLWLTPKTHNISLSESRSVLHPKSSHTCLDYDLNQRTLTGLADARVPSLTKTIILLVTFRLQFSSLISASTEIYFNWRTNMKMSQPWTNGINEARPKKRVCLTITHILSHSPGHTAKRAWTESGRSYRSLNVILMMSSMTPGTFTLSHKSEVPSQKGRSNTAKPKTTVCDLKKITWSFDIWVKTLNDATQRYLAIILDKQSRMSEARTMIQRGWAGRSGMSLGQDLSVSTILLSSC